MIKRESVRNQVKQERMDKHSLNGERWYCIHSMESVGIAFTQWRVSVLHSLYGERSGVAGVKVCSVLLICDFSTNLLQI